ncbi:MAG: hypothetical protein WDM77_14540 [Steroidobacteraceae bacterium]
MQSADVTRRHTDQQLRGSHLQQHGALLGSQTHFGDDVDGAGSATTNIAHAACEPRAQENGTQHDAQGKRDLTQARNTGSGDAGKRARGGENVRDRGWRGAVQRSFRMRSAGLMTSVRRMPNFSFTTTTSP